MKQIQIQIATAAQTLNGPHGIVKTGDQWEVFTPHGNDKIYIFQNDYCWQIDKETFQMHFSTTKYDILLNGKWAQADSERDKSFWDNQVRNRDYKETDEPTGLKKILDQIIVGSHSVTIPIKAFDIIYGDFIALGKQNLLLSDDRDLYMRHRDILIEALNKIENNEAALCDSIQRAREALRQVGAEL